MPTPEMTVEEITASIEKSNFISIIIEGKDDVVAFRRLERSINKAIDDQITLVPTGGREKLLKVMESLTGKEALKRCVFICDQDMWVLSNPPDGMNEYPIVLTDGYSIENDLIRDYPPTDLMSQEEETAYVSEIELFTIWFAAEAHKLSSGEKSNIAKFAGIVVETMNPDEIREHLASNIAANQMYELVSSDPLRYTRGKSILQIAIRQLSRPGRDSRHHHCAFLEHAAARNGSFFRRISTLTLEKVQRIIQASG